MKPIDRMLQSWRIRKVRPYLPAGGRVLDIGCADGALFRLAPGLGEYVGIDPAMPQSKIDPPISMIRGRFPDDLPDRRPFDAITLLAVLEHIPLDRHDDLARDCAASLKPGGRLLVTVPSAAVDRILDVLASVKLIDGMALDEHHGFAAEATANIFTAAGRFELVRRSRFQLGLNNLFVFRRPG